MDRANNQREKIRIYRWGARRFYTGGLLAFVIAGVWLLASSLVILSLGEQERFWRIVS